MEYDKNVCPVLDVDGVIASGKQFDLDIKLPEDHRNVIYGIIRDNYGDPVRDAVVKLVEIVYENGKEGGCMMNVSAELVRTQHNTTI